MKAYIKAIEYFLPHKEITNEQLVKEFPEWTVEKIANKVGVISRHIADENETATDLAIKAAEKLFFNNPDIKKYQIDFIIFCTQSPDYFLPSSSCIIQERVGLPTNVGAFDFNQGCSGYIYGLAISKGLVSAGIAKNVLLLTAETYNKRLHPKDKGNRTIFGDAATASIISTSGWGEILNFSLGTDGKGAENLILKTGGARHPEKANDLEFDENGNPISSDYIYMNGSEIFSFTQKNVPEVVKNTLEKNGLQREDINLFIFHQANKYMLEFLRKKIKIDKDKFFIKMETIGNTVSNSLPIAITEFLKEPLSKKPINILLCGFGVGYSWGGVIIRKD